MNIFKLHCSAQFCVSLAYAVLVIHFYGTKMFISHEENAANETDVTYFAHIIVDV